jgi:hypothetical protein
LRHLPKPSGVAIEAALVLGSMVLVFVVGRRLTVWRRRRRARPRRTWADLRLAELEEVGAKLGAPRQPAQTVQEYRRVLEAAGVPVQPLGRVVTAIEAEAFSGRPLTDGERERVVAALGEAEQAVR